MIVGGYVFNVSILMQFTNNFMVGVEAGNFTNRDQLNTEE